ncbi:hypothetical protein [Chondromyces apiculatus]|uniref:Uncharacterized protein n=1 Tax=Chondromyces apiculatus DSM 436 TaxID=1192034 RepID=A0A017SUH0_9BACT|nr:hypothetical protein [Chondromyces apiculatus]EYF00260.1 Hypothetical protein CAP_0989 [Chondromyces apiculatus DSM 436]
MKDDDLLRALGRAAREDDLLADPRWDALAAGELSEREVEALKALSRGDPEALGAFEAFEPVAAEVREAAAARARAMLQERPVGSVGSVGAEDAGGARGARGTRGARGAEVVRLPGRRKLLASVLAGAAAMAAAAVVWVMAGSGARDGLPVYALAVLGGEQTERHGGPPEAEGPPRIGPGSRLEIVLRPVTPAQVPVAVRGFLVSGGDVAAGGGRPWEPPVEISAEGSVRIAGSREALFPGVAPGEITLVLAVGRPEALPADAARAVAMSGAAAPSESAAAPSESAAVQVFRARVTLVSGGQ